MHYTVSPDHIVYTPTDGVPRRAHQDHLAVPTMLTAADINGLTWSIMEVQRVSGVTPVSFDKDSPDSWTGLLRALYALFIPVGVEVVMHRSPAEWDPNAVYPGTTWVQAPAKTVAGQFDSTAEPWHVLGNVVGSLTHTMTVDEMPAHSHTLTDSGEPNGDDNGLFDSAGTSSFSSTTVSTSTTGGGQAFSIVQPTQLVVRWIRTA